MIQMRTSVDSVMFPHHLTASYCTVLYFQYVLEFLYCTLLKQAIGFLPCIEHY